MECLISIHAPRVGSDDTSHRHGGGHYHFNPRSPCGERPKYCKRLGRRTLFQSTLPVWGATVPGQASPSKMRNFNPRSPCGERQVRITFVGGSVGFQSTLPVWGATLLGRHDDDYFFISIHAPRVGSDSCWSMDASRWAYFNPRSPCGERQIPTRK